MASAAPGDVAFKIAVHFESREDGGLRAYSDDVPGFVLSNANCAAVLEGVVPVLGAILSDMFNTPVRVVPLRDMAEVRDGLESAGIIDRKPRPRERVEYVTQLAA